MKMAADVAVAPVETAAALARMPVATVAPTPVTMVVPAPVAAAALGGAPVAAAGATSVQAETALVEKAAVAHVEMEVEVPVDEADNSGAEGRAYCLESILPLLRPSPPCRRCRRRCLVHLWTAPVHQQTTSAQFEDG